MHDRFIPHIDNLVNGGLMRKITPPEIAEELVRSGYAKMAVGGLMATDAAHKIMAERMKK